MNMVISSFFNAFWTIILMIILYSFVLIMHEFGHYLAFRFYGYKPKFPKFNLFGDIEIGIETHKKLLLKHILQISLAGILVGLIPLLFYNLVLDKSIMLWFFIAYFIGCSGDLSTIYLVIQDRQWKTTMYDLNKRIWKKYNESVSKD